MSEHRYLVVHLLDVLQSHRWYTLGELSDAVGGEPVPSISARIRDLRKPFYGGYRIDRRQRAGAPARSYEYRLVPREEHGAAPSRSVRARPSAAKPRKDGDALALVYAQQELDAAHRLYNAAMDAIHAAAGIPRDGLAGILGWIDEARSAMMSRPTEPAPPNVPGVPDAPDPVE